MTLATLLRRSASVAYKRAFGFANSEWRLIGLLGDNGPMLQSAIVEALGQDKGQTSRALSRLSDKRLILRERTASGVLIALNREGRAIFDSMSALIRRRNTLLLAGLDAHERAVLGRALDRLIANAQALLNADLEVPERRARPDRRHVRPVR